MKFCCFNPIPWPALDRRPDQWPFPNSAYDSSTGSRIFSQSIEQLVYAEECGFDWVGVGEDHMTAYGITPNPLLILSIIAQRTKRVKLAILGAPLPLLNPIRVAEECAMIDVLSNGRLIAGFIRGVPQNYAAYNIDPDESRARFAQANELIHKAWTHEGVFDWESEYYKFPTVSIWPRPTQCPHPPVLYSANSETSAVLAAKQRAMIGTIHLYSMDAIERISAVIAAYKAQAQTDGWEPGPDRFLVGLQTCIAETDEQAMDILRPALDYQYGVLSGTYNKKKREIAEKSGYGYSPVEEHPPTIEERLDKGLILCGSPETVIRQIQTLKEKLGIGVLSMHLQVGNMDDRDVRKSMSLFRKHVRPAFLSDEDSHGVSKNNFDKPTARSLDWTTTSRETVHSSPWYNILKDQIQLPDGEQRAYTYIDHPGSIFVVPVTDNGEIVLLRSYRYTVDHWCWEVPAGGMGDHEGKDPQDVAHIELLEETGSKATSMVRLGGRFLGNGFAKHWGEFFIAYGVSPTQPTTTDQTEVITELKSVSIDQAREMALDGTINDGDSALAILLAVSVLQSQSGSVNGKKLDEG